MSIEFLDPTHENRFANFKAAPRLRTLDNTVIAFISNGKKGSIPFFDALERELMDTKKVAEIVRITKSNYSTPVDAKLLDGARRWNALVSGIGD